MLDKTSPTEQLNVRSDAVEAFITAANKLTIVGPLGWDTVQANPRLLAVNYVLRRQREAIDAAIKLSRSNLGHLGVTFVRPALEERIWIAYLTTLDVPTAKKLFDLLGRNDIVRTLVAQRDYIGDEGMTGLWYPAGFVDAQGAALGNIRADLRALGAELGWGGSVGPSSEWVARQAGLERQYKYLFAATSRAIHFSAGEIMRRGWGWPGQALVTDKPEFRAHLAEFALDQLWRLYMATVASATTLLGDAGIVSDEELTEDDIKPALDQLLALGNVPLLHAAEFNLTPEGPLDLPPHA